MFRKPVKRKEQAARQRADPVSDEEEKADIIKDAIKRKRRENPMLQSTKKKGKEDIDGSSSSSEEEVTTLHSFPASGSDAPLGPSDGGATFTTEKDTAYDADAHSQFERVQQILKEGGVEKDGKTLYKGMAMYGAKIAPDTIKGNAANGLNRIGPMRASQFMRQTVRWDYAPDICKDYKETGFCTFGDSCKFLHDRSDYKHGWEIERDYLAGNLNEVDETNYEIPEENEDILPEECFICGNPFVDPVVTSCKHYFCEGCAVKAFKKSKKCRICNENTGGIFNVAKDLIQKMKERKEQENQPKEEEEDEEEIETKPDIKKEEHHHDETCNHSHEIKEEPLDEGDEEEAEDTEEDIEVDNEPQEEVNIEMEDIEDDGNISNTSDYEDAQDESSDTIDK